MEKHGVLFVTMAGQSKMLMWHADNWDSLDMASSSLKQNLTKGEKSIFQFPEIQLYYMTICNRCHAVAGWSCAVRIWCHQF